MSYFWDGLLINISKTKIMVINMPENNSSQVQEVNGIEVVNRFTYILVLLWQTHEVGILKPDPKHGFYRVQ